jgi:exodeoxyribonuclease-1
MADPVELGDMVNTIKNKRLRALVPLYKARNFPEKLTPEEHAEWEKRRFKLFYGTGQNGQLSRIGKCLEDIAKTRTLSANDEYLLSELQLYIESILPEAPEAENSETDELG